MNNNDSVTELCNATPEQFERFEAAAKGSGHSSGKSAANDGNLWGVSVADAIAAVEDDPVVDESPAARLERAKNGCRLYRRCELDQVYVCIPHQIPAFVRDSLDYPPDEEDGDHSIRGDHDWHGCISVESALTWRGHQWAKVQTLAERLIFELSR